MLSQNIKYVNQNIEIKTKRRKVFVCFGYKKTDTKVFVFCDIDQRTPFGYRNQILRGFKWFLKTFQRLVGMTIFYQNIVVKTKRKKIFIYFSFSNNEQKSQTS